MAYDVEKNIAFKIEQQFPAIYREEQNELVSLVTDFYKFMETQSNQAVYNSRRMFEYRDITTTLQSMIIFFQKKYLVDLPLLDDASVRLLVKNILALYRRKGSENGITLFFRMFYQEDIQIYNPSNNIFKPSDSNWRTGEFLQLIPNSGTFYARDGVTYYNYGDLLNKNIVGSTSHAKAAVDKINLILLNNTLTPGFKNSTKNPYLAPIPYGQRLGNTFRSAQIRGSKKIIRRNYVDPQFGRLVGTGGAGIKNNF